MSYQGEATWHDYGYKAGELTAAVQVGDLVVTEFRISNYLLRDGQSVFDSADVRLPLGWVLVHVRVVRAGGDPRRIAELRAVAATVMTAASPRSGLQAVSAVPYYQQDQDPGSWAPTYGFSTLYWRGEKGIADVAWFRQETPVHVATLLPGRSRDGSGSVWRWLSSPTGDYADSLLGGSWMSTDDSAVANKVPYPYSDGDVAAVGSGGQRYAWYSAWTGTKSLPYYSSAKSYDSVAVTMTTASYPLAPLLTAPPAGGLLDLERDGVTVAWTHRPSLAGPQAGWALQHSSGATTHWWNAAAKSWAATQVLNPGTLTAVDLPASAFPAATGFQHTFQVATCGSNQELSILSDPVTVTAVVGPSASASVVGADLAGSLASLRPQVAISGTARAGVLTSWSATLVDATDGKTVATGAGDFTPAAQAATWAPDVEVGNGHRVQAIVRVQQTGGAWSVPVVVETVVDVDVPGAPTVVVTTGAHVTSGAPAAQVRVDFPWQADGYVWTSRATVLRLQRQDGGEWVDIAQILLPPGRTSAVLDDYSAAAGTLVYRARGEGQAVDGSHLIGAWGYSTPKMLAVPGGWLIDPNRPEAAQRVDLVGDDARSIDLRSVRMAAIGRDEELVAAGTPLLESGQVTLRVRTPAHRAAVLDLLRSGAVLKLTFCSERDVFDAGRRQAAESLWFRPVGDIGSARMVERGPWSGRRLTVPFVTQRPPVQRAAQGA